MTRFDELTSPQVGRLVDSDRDPVLLLPVGATEPHGPHAPLGTDTLISLAMCRRAADQMADDPDVQVLVLPPLAYGVTHYASAFPGAVGLTEDTLRAVICDVCTSLIDQGFPHIVVVNNHLEPEHIRALHGALDSLEAHHGSIVGYLDLTRRYRAQALTEEFRKGESHAGRYETSMVLAERADLVDRERMSRLPRVAVDMAAAIADGQHDFGAMGMKDAYCGAPAEATEEEGEETLATLTEMLVEIIREVAQGRGGRDRPGRGG